MKYEITEKMIEHASTFFGPDSTFVTILEQGYELKAAGLTPVYIFDNILGIVEVTTDENIKNKLN